MPAAPSRTAPSSSSRPRPWAGTTPRRAAALPRPSPPPPFRRFPGPSAPLNVEGARNRRNRVGYPDGMLIEIPAADGTAEALVARPSSGEGPFPGVILSMDAFGLRPRIQDMAQRIADWGYVVLAPNVFYREGTAASLAPATDMTTQEGREAAGAAAFPRVGRLTTDKALPDIDSWVDALARLDGVAPGSIGVVGYCMGARLAMRSATAHPDTVAACGGFHGGGLATEESDSPHLALGN